MQSKIAACSYSKYKIVWNNTELLGKSLRGSYYQLINWLKIFWNWVLALILIIYLFWKFFQNCVRDFSEFSEKQLRMLSSRILDYDSNLVIIFSTSSLVRQKLYNRYHQKLRKFPGKLPVTETSFCNKVRIILEVCQTLKTELFLKNC